MRRFCLTCGAEYEYITQRCPQCGVNPSDESFREGLIKALTHTIPSNAAFAADILGKLGASEALPALLAASYSEEPERAEAALRALGAFSDERARQRIREARNDDRARMRAIANRLLEAESSHK